MYATQQALIALIEQHFTYSQPVHVDAYAGQIEGDAIKSTVRLPAVFVMVQGGEVMKQADNTVRVTLIVITDSKVLDKKSKKNANLQLASELAAWLLERNIFFGEISPYRTYHIQNPVDVGIHSITDRHCVAVLFLTIKDRIA